MKKGLIKAGVLLLLFVGTAAGTLWYINRGTTQETREMEEPTLPVLYMEVEGTLVNPMYGYADEMEEQYIRDSLTPLSTGRALTMIVEPMGSKVEAVNYRVSTADGTTVVEEGKIKSLQDDGENLRAEFQVENPILMNQEYTLRFEIQLENGENYFYYTRLLQRAGLNIKEYLTFAKDFYESCTTPETASDLSAYLEPDDTQSNSTYTSVNIHSSFDMITWGELNPEIVQEAVPVIKDMNETTCSIVMEYVLSSTEEDNPSDLLQVTDFYRMRYDQSRMRLLDFERNAEELFDGENTDLTSNGLNLGITDRTIQYQSNQNADIVAFVQQGELWSYNRSANKTTRVFSFRNGDLDARELLQEHGIKIVRVEESGDIDFVVYGYMNKDAHEGEVGIAVYHYGAEQNLISEELFIPMNTSYEYLKSDMERLSYVSREDMLYLLLEDDLYKIDIARKTYEIIQENIQQDCCVISSSQASIAWMDQMSQNASTSITVLSLESGEQYTVQAQEGQKVKALGFINEDFIYGIANDADIVTDDTGTTVFAMNTVRIQNFSGEVVKEYHEDNVWISGVNILEGSVELLRVQWENDAYVSINSDHIMNNLQTSEETVSIRLITTDRKATQIGLDFDRSVSSSNVLYLASSILENEESTQLGLEVTRQEEEIYYVYAKGSLDSTWLNVNEAVTRAYEQMGVVLNRQQQYVWERGNQPDLQQLDTETLPASVLAGSLDQEALAAELGDGYTVLNLTGCPLESVLYMVGKGYPVIARTSSSETVVIIGYNSLNTILYYPSTGEQGYYGMNDSTNLFEAAGNVFITYMENMGEPSKGE